MPPYPIPSAVAYRYIFSPFIVFCISIRAHTHTRIHPPLLQHTIPISMHVYTQSQAD
ncbi:hypothetical protein C8Q73DRAFT_707544 [Cubamyces lactineus]|nr:hypothetical protein C8Q73DRAFT_707544 [Cubamyces lactineus]